MKKNKAFVILSILILVFVMANKTEAEMSAQEKHSAQAVSAQIAEFRSNTSNLSFFARIQKFKEQFAKAKLLKK